MSRSHTAASSLPALFPSPLLGVSRQGEVVLVNEAMLRFLEGTESAIVGQPIEHYFTPGGGDGELGDILAGVTAEESWRGRLDRVGADETSLVALLEPAPGDPETLYLIALENPVPTERLVWGNRSDFKILRILLENTLDYVWMKDTEGRFILTNSAYSQAIGADFKGAEIGRTIHDFTDKEAADFFTREDQQVLKSGEPVLNERRLFRPKRTSPHWVQVTKVPVFEKDGTPTGIVCVSHDITPLVESEASIKDALQRAEAANKAQREFLANMTHDIRTPMNGILGMTELAIDRAVDDSQRHDLESVLSCGRTLLALLNSILDYSRIESGFMRLQKSAFELRTIVDETLREHDISTRGKDVRLVGKVDDSVPVGVLGDGLRFKQILSNLIGNALKFTDHGSVTVEVRVSPDEASNEENRICVEVDVSDTGIGIPAEQQERIFSPFTQVDATTSKKREGTGLGLSIVRQLVEMMDGSIDLSSTLGEGSCFTVRVPFAVAEEAQPETEKRQLSILLAEDNPVNQRLYEVLLNRLGHRVATVGSGQAALDSVSRQDYDLILLDVQMPGMDGFEASRQIRARENGSHVPIVGLTAHAMDGDDSTCREAGMDDVLGKPFRLSEFERVISKLVKG